MKPIGFRSSPFPHQKTVSTLLLTRRVCLSSVFVLLSAAILLGSGGQGSWKEHLDSTGFAVNLPQGFSAEGGKGGYAFISNSDKSVFAVVQPFKAPPETDLASTIPYLVGHMSSLFPESKVSGVSSSGQDGDQAVARVSYVAHGIPSRANVLCYRNGAGSMFYAIGAPNTAFSRDRQTLVRILSSFKYEEAGRPQKGAHSQDLGTIHYVKWTDPREEAFTVDAPKGWIMVGGTFRFGPVDVRKNYGAASPDGTVKVRFGDARLTAFVPYNASARMRGLRTGQSYTVNAVTYTVLSPMSGENFSSAYINSMLKKQYSGLRVTGSKPRRDIEGFLEKTNGSGQNQISCGETDFTFNENGEEMSGAVVATTVKIGPQGGLWIAIPTVVTAPANRMDTAWEVWKHLTLPKDSAAWTEKQNGISQRFNQMVAANHEATMAQLHEQYMKASNELNQSSRHWDNIVNGVEDVKDPYGNTRQVAAGHNYYYSNGSGVTGNDTGDSPGANFTPLTKF